MQTLLFDPPKEKSANQFKIGQVITDKDGGALKVRFIVDGYPIGKVSDRVYGSGEYRVTYHWFNVYDYKTDQWKSFGDPFPGYPTKEMMQNTNPEIYANSTTGW